MKIIQIVGYKNSGKTTLVSKIIEMLSNDGVRIASLKHHGHGGIPLGFEQTDSEKHKQAGALIAGVEGEGVLQLSKESWDIAQIIAFYKFMEMEVLIVEGYKYLPFPKVVLIHKNEDICLLKQVDNVKAIITSISLKDIANSYTVFNTKEVDKFLAWIYTYIQRGKS